MAAERLPTIRAGEVRFEDIGTQDARAQDARAPCRNEVTGTERTELDPWVGRLIAVVDHVMSKAISSSATSSSATGGGGRWIGAALALLYLLMIVGYALGAMHIVGDGTLKAKVNRTECYVEWLVGRSVAEDRGEPKPSFSPLSCTE